MIVNVIRLSIINNFRAAHKLHYPKKHTISKKDLKKKFKHFSDITKSYSNFDFLESKWTDKLLEVMTTNKLTLMLY